MGIRQDNYGIREDSEPRFEVCYLCDDPKIGRWVLIRGQREEVEIRITKTGRLRIGDIRRAGKVRSWGFEE